MITQERLKEFGFHDLSQFPRQVNDSAVTLSLPAAGSLRPVTVVIERGLIIPVQMPQMSQGMIIREDGSIAYVSTDPADKTLLNVKFINDISFDLRAYAYNVMRRASEADPELKGIWQKIMGHWLQWFPPAGDEIQRRLTGEFKDLKESVKALGELIETFLKQISQSSLETSHIPLRVMVQTSQQMKEGWPSEEFTADQITVGEVRSEGVEQYINQRLIPKLRPLLKTPVFHWPSTVYVYYEPRIIPVFKLVFDAETAVWQPLSSGIDF